MARRDDFKFNATATQFEPNGKRNVPQYYVTQVPAPYVPTYYPCYPNVSDEVVRPPGLIPHPSMDSIGDDTFHEDVPVVKIDLQGRAAERVVSSLLDDAQDDAWFLQHQKKQVQELLDAHQRQLNMLQQRQAELERQSPKDPLVNVFTPPKDPFNTVVGNLRNSLYQFSLFSDETDAEASSVPASAISTPVPPEADQGKISWAQMAIQPSPKSQEAISETEQVQAPSIRYVLKVSQLPRDVTSHEIRVALASYKCSPNPIVHFILDRIASGKHLMVQQLGPRDVQVGSHFPPITGVFIEVGRPLDAKNLLRVPLKIRGRDVAVEEATQKDLLTALFPRYTLNRTKKQTDNELFFFVGPDEVKTINGRVSFSEKD
jgi:hypothetical protein